MENVLVCKGMNCGCTDGINHSAECHAEHAAAIAGGTFVKYVPQESKHVFATHVAFAGEEIPPWRTCDVCGRTRDNAVHTVEEG